MPQEQVLLVGMPLEQVLLVGMPLEQGCHWSKDDVVTKTGLELPCCTRRLIFGTVCTMHVCRW